MNETTKMHRYRIVAVERSTGREVQVYPNMYDAASPRQAAELFAADRGAKVEGPGMWQGLTFYVGGQCYAVKI
jgi:hypothetical protein